MHQNLIRTIRILILVALLFLLSMSIAITAQPLGRLANKKIIFVSGYKGFLQLTDREVNPLEEDWKPLRDHLVSKYRELTNDDFFFYSYSGEYHNNDYSDPDYTTSDTCLGVIKEKLVSPVCISSGVDYDKRAEYMDEIVQAVVNTNPGAEIEIIGHSLGGVISTYWAATTTKPKLLESINSIITLDSPLQGEGGRCWRRIGFTVIPFDVTSKITSSVVKVPILTISNPNDEVIPPSSSVLAEGLAWSNFSSRSGESCCKCITSTSGHTAVKTDPIVHQRIERALLAGKILNPTTEKKLFAGPFDNPLTGMINLAKPAFTFLKAPAHQVQVDGQAAQLLIANFDDQGVTRLKATFPTQPSDGDYDLTVVSDSPDDRWDFIDTETQAIRYGPGVGNVDVVLVIDRSGSMTGQKIADAKNAAKLFVDLMTNGDKIGVVSFSNSATVNYGLTTIAGVRDDAKNAIGAIRAGGTTSIGTGLQKGGDELTNKGDSTHPWAIVLLSNGQENTAPLVADVLPSIKAAGIVVYAVGLGAGVNQPLLEDVAKQTGGLYFFAPSSQDLQTIYNLISGAIAGQQTISSSAGTVQQGSTDERGATIDSTVSEATFSLGWGGSDLDLTLETPSASIIDPVVAATEPDIDFVSAPTYEFYRIKSPEIGDWAMRISGTHVDPPGPEQYTTRVAVRTGLTVELYFGNQAAYFTYDPIPIGLALSDFQPILGASVLATIESPSGTTSQLPLFDDGQHEDGTVDDGFYGNTFTGTLMNGSYQFLVQAEGISNNGEMFTRSIEESVFVEQKTNLPADLFITMTGPVQAEAGSTLSYEITYGNNGPTSAADVSIMSILPEGASYVGDTLGGAQLAPGIGVSWTLGILNPGAQRTFNLTVATPPTVTAGITIENEVSVFDDDEDGSLDPDPIDNFAIVATEITPSCDQLVINGGFETDEAWRRGNTPRPAAYTTEDFHFGNRSMRLGIRPPTSDTYSHSSVYQAISIPADATSATLTFWYKPFSQDPVMRDWRRFNWESYDPSQNIRGQDARSGPDPSELNWDYYDWQEALILDADYQLLDTVMRINSNTGTWTRKTFDLMPYAGQTINIYFNVYNGGLGNQVSWMYLDDVSVEICSQPSLATVRVSPSTQQVGMGQLATTCIRIEGVTGLYGADVSVNFDPARLEVQDGDLSSPGIQIQPGTFPDPHQGYVVQNSADNGAGEINYAISLLSPALPASGSGDLACITFSGKGVGTSPVTFVSASLLDRQAVQIPTRTENGAIVVSSSGTIAGRAFLQGRGDHRGISVRADNRAGVETSSDGSYTLNGLPPAAYAVTANAACYLSVRRDGVTVSPGGTTTLPDVTLPGGDINNDCLIDIFDLVAVGANYGIAGPVNPSCADVNADGQVDVFDLVLVGSNYGRSCPASWSPSAFRPTSVKDGGRPTVRLTTVEDQGETKTATVELTIEQARSLYGVHAVLSFDPTKLQVLDSDPWRSGVQITPTGDLDFKKAYIVRNLADNETGKIVYALTLLSPALPLSGDGVLGHINFKRLDTESAAIHLSELQLASQGGARLSANIVKNHLLLKPLSNE